MTAGPGAHVVLVAGGFALVACARTLAARNIACPLRSIASECDRFDTDRS